MSDHPAVDSELNFVKDNMSLILLNCSNIYYPKLIHNMHMAVLSLFFLNFIYDPARNQGKEN